MSYIAKQARSFDHALELVASGSPNVISRLPLGDLMNHAAHVQDGLFDFDGTLTPGSQWRAIASLMPEELREIDMENYRWYHSHLHDRDAHGVSLDDPDWWVGHLHSGNKLAVDGALAVTAVYLFAQAGITREQIDEVAVKLPARRGVGELLALMRNKAVVSFGVEQFIQAWLRHQGLELPVAASRLIFDEQGVVQRPHINIMGSRSKEYAAERFRRAMSTPERELLVVGDSVVDIHMMSPDSFNVLIIPPSELDRKMRDFRENNLAAMWPRITMILADDSLEPLAELLRDARSNC